MNSITDVIGVGRENAVTREQLAAMLGLPDRTVRRMIAEARDEGAVIINLSDGRGYYVSEELNDLYRQYNTNRSRALSILRQQKHLERKIEEAEGKDQVTIEEVANG